MQQEYNVANSFLQLHRLKTSEDFQKYNGTVQIYQQCIEEIQKLPYYQQHQIRKNGNIAIHIYMRGDVGKDKCTTWQQANLSWVREIFTLSSIIISDNGITNEHFQEHHVFLVPVSPAGRVSYEYYCNSRGKLRLIQDTYAEKMKILFNLKRTPATIVKRSARAGLYSATDHPSTLPSIPIQADYKDIQAYCTALQKYLVQMQNYYESRISTYKDTEHDKLLLENKYLKKENQKLDKYMGLFLAMTDQFGGIKKMQQMLSSAQLIQFATRLYQEDGDKEMLDEISRVFLDGQKYIQRHNLKT